MEVQQQRGSVQPASVVAMLSTRRKGMVKWFNATKRPGCVTPDNGNEYTFFHQSPLKSDGYCNLNVGDSVEFDFSTDGDGRLRAVGATSPGVGAHTGSFHSDGGNHGCAYACYGKDGELGYDGGSSNGSYSCGDEVVSFLVSSGSAAHRVFDEMPHLAVVWDDELQHSSDLHDGLLKQLAEGVDYVVDEEFQNSLDLHDDLLQQGALGRQCTDDELVKWDDDEVLDKIPFADVIWGEEIEHDHDRLPIKASADKLAREVQQYEYPPVFPAAEENVNSKMAENQADQSAAVALDKLKSRKSKAVTKTGAQKFQWEIMKDLASWTPMIGGAVHGAEWFVLMNSLNRMRSEGFTPDSMIFTAVILPCGRVKELGTGMALHGCSVRCGVGDDICVSNALVAMYCKCACLDMAISLFQSISYKDVTSWSTIIAGHSQNGIHNVSANLFTEIVACGVKPNSSTMASILPCLSELKLLRYGKKIHCFSIRNAFEHSEFLTSALLYTEPERKVMSRSGDECVVALTDQWYITIDKKVLGSALFFLMMVADGASRNVEHMGQLQMPWDPGGFHIFLVSVQQWKRGGFSLGECVEQLERYNMAPFYLRIWDADIQHSRLQEAFHASACTSSDHGATSECAKMGMQ